MPYSVLSALLQYDVVNIVEISKWIIQAAYSTFVLTFYLSLGGRVNSFGVTDVPSLGIIADLQLWNMPSQIK